MLARLRGHTATLGLYAPFQETDGEAGVTKISEEERAHMIDALKIKWGDVNKLRHWS